MRSIGRLFAIALLAFALPGPAAAEMPKLTIGAYGSYSSLKALKLGIVEGFRRLGYRAEIVNLPPERSLTAANSGEIDGDGLRTIGIDARFPNLIRVPEPILTIRYTAYSKHPAPKVESWQDLAGYRVAHITGWQYIAEHAAGALSVTQVDHPEQLFQMLMLDRIDFALYEEGEGDAYLRSNDIPGVVAITPPIDSANMYLYLHKKHIDLIDPLTEIVKEMKHDISVLRASIQFLLPSERLGAFFGSE